MRVYYDTDADLGLIKSKKVGIIGFGSQRACACTKFKGLRDKEYCYWLGDGSSSAKKAKDSGLKVMSVSELSAWADMITMCT